MRHVHVALGGAFAIASRRIVCEPLRSSRHPVLPRRCPFS